MAPVIRFERFSYTYPGAARPALKNIELEIPDGILLGIVGANGAGKSSLCAAIAGFIPHHFSGHVQGKVLIDDLDATTGPLSEVVRRTGFVFQNPFNQLTGTKRMIADEVAFGLENLGVERTEMHARVLSVLERLGLTPLADRSPYSLSGGEMQKVALASILVMEPRVLVLDEPTAQLDPAGARQVYAALKSILAARACTVILADQKTEWIAEFADRVVALNDGEVVLDGLPREVLASTRMLEIGVVPTRYTQAAGAARERSLWPNETPIAVTIDQATAGFAALNSRAEERGADAR